MVTDIGIELGKLLYWNADPGQPRVGANLARLALLAALLMDLGLCSVSSSSALLSLLLAPGRGLIAGLLRGRRVRARLLRELRSEGLGGEGT